MDEAKEQFEAWWEENKHRRIKHTPITIGGETLKDAMKSCWLACAKEKDKQIESKVFNAKSEVYREVEGLLREVGAVQCNQLAIGSLKTFIDTHKGIVNQLNESYRHMRALNAQIETLENLEHHVGCKIVSKQDEENASLRQEIDRKTALLIAAKNWMKPVIEGFGAGKFEEHVIGSQIDAELRESEWEGKDV